MARYLERAFWLFVIILFMVCGEAKHPKAQSILGHITKGSPPSGTVAAGATAVYPVIDQTAVGGLFTGAYVKILAYPDSMKNHQIVRLTSVTSDSMQFTPAWAFGAASEAKIIIQDKEVGYDANGLMNYRITQTDSFISYQTYTRKASIAAEKLGLHDSATPVIDIYGITYTLEMTVNTDFAYYKQLVPPDYSSGDISVYVYWTRSTTGTDESSKTVKWQVKNLALAVGEDCATGESTDSIQDVYDDNDTADQIVYKTDAVTIAAAEVTNNDWLLLEIESITVDSGDALADPAIVGIELSYSAWIVPR